MRYILPFLQTSTRKLCHVLTCRNLTTSRRLCQNAPLQVHSCIMPPFSKLQLLSDIPVWIKPLNPHDFPQMNKFILSIWSTDEVKDVKRRYNLDVEEIDDGLSVNMTAEQGLPVFCDIQLPLNAELDLVMKNDLQMSKMESGFLKVLMEKGNCRLLGMKCSLVDIQSRQGDVISTKSLHGDLTLTVENGSFSADRLQGQNIHVVSRGGDVNVKSLYAVTSSVRCKESCVNVKSCHGETSIHLDKGSIDVGSLDGNLTAEVNEGDISVHIMRHNLLDLTTHSGSIHVTTDQPNPSQVALSARRVDISSELSLSDEHRRQNGDLLIVEGNLRSESSAKISCSAHRGEISFRFQEWLSTLKMSQNFLDQMK